MMHADAFLQDVIDNEYDDLPRRIYADWLMDHGDRLAAARGEFIHLQCNLAQYQPDAKRPAELLRRERELLAMYGRIWGADFARLGCRCWEYRRGFVEGVGLPAEALLRHGAELMRLAPIREIKLYESAGLLDRLGQSGFLSAVRILDLENNQLEDRDLAALAESHGCPALRTLYLWSNRISDDGLRALVQGQLALEQVDLSHNLLNNDGIIALADSLFFDRLRRLVLSSNRIGDPAGLALAASPFGRNLVSLDLSKNSLGAEVMAALRVKYAGRVHLSP
ncbi:MAG: TIGR02996 domain-containing protein [Gemmataceae bacterium]